MNLTKLALTAIWLSATGCTGSIAGQGGRSDTREVGVVTSIPGRATDGPSRAAHETGARAGQRPPARCGDIVADMTHPPFEAIKLLATTSEEVRILVYGQSISEQDWWWYTRDWLKAQYPKGNLVMEQHARGGCSSQCLVGRDAWTIDKKTYNRLPEDVLAWKPDLILFNVYGRHDDYEYIVKAFKQGCAAFDDHPSPTARCSPTDRYPDYKPAEVLLQTYHRVNDTDFDFPLTLAPPASGPQGYWEYWMAKSWIPHLAQTYGAYVQNTWDDWWTHLKANGLKAADLLKDGVHLNEAGNRLMAKLTEPHLCYAPQ